MAAKRVHTDLDLQGNNLLNVGNWPGVPAPDWMAGAYPVGTLARASDGFTYRSLGIGYSSAEPGSFNNWKLYWERLGYDATALEQQVTTQGNAIQQLTQALQGLAFSATEYQYNSAHPAFQGPTALVQAVVWLLSNWSAGGTTPTTEAIEIIDVQGDDGINSLSVTAL